MGRAARRQQERAERRSQTQQVRTPRSMQASTSAPAPAAARGRGSLLRPRWASDILSELKKVTWPTRQETTHLTVVVITVSIAFAALLGAADVGFSWLIEQTILK